MVKREGKDVLLNLSDSRSLDPTRKIDSGAFLLGSHTVALWNFDSLLQTGEILDRSPFANHLRYDGTPQLVPSPHGKAFSQSSGLAASVPRSGQLPPSLQWTRTGLMTWEIRFRMDTVPLSGMVVFGSKSGLRLWITGIGQLVVESPVHGADGIEIGSLVSAPEVVPLGKWIDIAISVDAPNRQVYAWVDEMAIPLAARQNWSNGTSMD
ncbi:MAG TPA: hypothetical protein PKW90_27620, partial [Myxococcota bacterium]|nr:hypothetical protein [Myxococcota bacterium]